MPCRLLVPAAFLSLALGSQPAPAAPAPPVSTRPAAASGFQLPVVVLRDTRGIPHVYGLLDRDVYFGLGYACAEDRFLQMSLSKWLMQGRLAELLGADAIGPGDGVYLQHDRLVRVYGYERLAQKVVASMDPAGRDLLQSYADGVNRFLFPPDGSSPTVHPFFGGLFVPTLGTSVTLPIEPWRPEDSILVWFRISRLFTPAEPQRTILFGHVFEDWLASGGTFVDGQPQGGDIALFDQIFPPPVFDAGSAPVTEAIDPQFEQRVDEVAAAAWLAAQPCPSVASFASSGGGGSLFPGGTLLSAPFLGDAIEFDPFLAEQAGLDTAIPSFSHAWAVAGDGQGRPSVLLGDPRLEVRVPNDFWEASMRSLTFGVRGAMLPGNPNVLVGSTGFAGWSVTALGLMQADAFELTVDPVGHPDEYLLDGVWTPMAVSQEAILVRQPDLSQQSVPFEYRESVWGPVVTRFPGDDQLALPEVRPGEVFAVQWLPFHSPQLEPTASFRDIYRTNSFKAALQGKTTAELFRERLGGWTWPGANLVFADSGGRVGFAAVGTLPLRSCLSPLGGQIFQDGSSTAFQWSALVPSEFMPWIIKEPRADQAASVHSANNSPVDGSWYPIPLANRGGDTTRSRRLRELLAALPPDFDPRDDVFALHEDAGWNNARDLVRLGLHLRDQQGFPLSPEALSSLQLLEFWASPTGVNAQLDPAFPIETALARFTGFRPFRPGQIDRELLDRYGVGDFGLNFFLRDLTERVGGDPAATITPEEAFFVDAGLRDGWNLINLILGPDPVVWGNWYLATQINGNVRKWDPTERVWVPNQNRNVNLPPLDPTTIPVGPIKVSLALTLFSQFGQVYSQWLELGSPFHGVRESLLALGQSEIPGSAHELDQLDAWITDGTVPQVFTDSPIDPPFVVESSVLLFH